MLKLSVMQLCKAVALVVLFASCGTERGPISDAKPGFSGVMLDTGPNNQRYDAGAVLDGPVVHYDSGINGSVPTDP